VQYKKTHKNKGFTLVEIILVVAIFALLTAITIYNYGNFNSNIIMTNLAYEVALEVRQAQVYSLSVRASDAVVPSDPRAQFKNRFGIYLGLGGSNDESLIFFADANKNGVCDLDSVQCLNNVCSDSATDECDHMITLTRGITFDKICVGSVADPVVLNDGGGGTPGECEVGVDSVTELNVTFERPNPDALILGDGSSYDNVGIVLTSQHGSKRAVVIRKSGQISVEHISNN